ncbi:fibroin heavy chain-like isoform X2 [Chelonus insularis]|uniref:fibroin heavy chain-like isoform X2 n=1 Tax=Chelonus insularis TaxID=460826 RepID=UPI00158E56F7|nr:fibroin heavy chain-like isoform X2 [Chelonus insularis]
MYKIVSFLAVCVSVVASAPSGLLYGHGVGLAGPVLGAAGLAGPAVGPAALSGPVAGPARISGAVDGGAVVTGSVAGPSVVSGSVVGGTAVVEPGYGYGLGYGWNGLAHGAHGAVLAGPVLGHAAISGPAALPAVVAGPSGSIVAGGGYGHGHRWWGH